MCAYLSLHNFAFAHAGHIQGGIEEHGGAFQAVYTIVLIVKSSIPRQFAPSLPLDFLL